MSYPMLLERIMALGVQWQPHRMGLSRAGRFGRMGRWPCRRLEAGREGSGGVAWPRSGLSRAKLPPSARSAAIAHTSSITTRRT